MSSLLAVDWGTSSFRLMHVGVKGELLAQINSDRGVSKLNSAEMQPFLLEQIASLDLDSPLPIILCGMVGSTLGWQDAGYATCPIDPKLLSGELVRLDCDGLEAFIVPGLKTCSSLGQPDVMRGEETQVVGWLSQASEADLQQSVLCLPGTHSKWVKVEEGRIINFNTVFTGELYAVLTQHSILARGEQLEDSAAFAEGLEASRQSLSLLHLLFSTRSRLLAGLHHAESCAAYLSGLLVGAEVRASLMQWQGCESVQLIGGTALTERYQSALDYYGASSSTHEGDSISARGLWQLYQFSKAQ